jgi:hypothetical protein
MLRTRWPAVTAGCLGLLILGTSSFSGCSDERRTTGTRVEKPPGADAGEKASREFMRSRMMKGGMTKK